MNALLLFLLLFIDPSKIGKVNETKSEARKAYERGEYEKSAALYKMLDSLGVKEDEVTMNLGHSYFHLNDSANAQNSYLALTGSRDTKLRSIANQQLGVMANRQGKFEAALDYFKNSLRANPSNADARYNYEMVKKKLEEKKKQEEQNNRNQPQEPPSEFARRLKAQADALVSQRRYAEAFNLLDEGLKKDKTISNYQEFMNRAKSVAGIK